MKKLLTSVLAAIMLFTIIPTKVLAEEENTKTTEAIENIEYEIEGYNENDIKYRYYDENGNEILILINGDVVIRDYSFKITQSLDSEYHNPKYSVRSLAGFILIAKGVIKVVGGVLMACQIFYYATGTDVCLEFSNYIRSAFNSPAPGDYGFYGKYVKQRIPGCEPMHSAQCNGYWEYIVKKL